MSKAKIFTRFKSKHDITMPSRSQLRAVKAKEEAVKFLTNVSYFLAVAAFVLATVKLMVVIEDNNAKRAVHLSADISAGKTGRAVEEVALLRSRDQLGISSSRGAVRPATAPVPPPPPPPVDSPHTIAWINSINKFLAGSPMAGMGEVFYKAAKRNGIDPRLSPAIAMTESGLGRAIPGGYNAYGMTAGTAPGHGRIGSWQAFAGWPDAIESNISFIKRKWGSVSSPANMRGYATSTTWVSKVSGAMSRIGNPGPEPVYYGPFPEGATP